MFPLVTGVTADGILVVVSCQVLKLARQPYYGCLRDPVARRELEDACRANWSSATRLACRQALTTQGRDLH